MTSFLVSVTPPTSSDSLLEAVGLCQEGNIPNSCSKTRMFSSDYPWPMTLASEHKNLLHAHALVQLPINFCTVSDKRLGGIWKWGYAKTRGQYYNHCLKAVCLNFDKNNWPWGCTKLELETRTDPEGVCFLHVLLFLFKPSLGLSLCLHGSLPFSSHLGQMLIGECGCVRRPLRFCK